MLVARRRDGGGTQRVAWQIRLDGRGQAAQYQACIKGRQEDLRLSVCGEVPREWATKLPGVQMFYICMKIYKDQYMQYQLLPNAYKTTSECDDSLECHSLLRIRSDRQDLLSEVGAQQVPWLLMGKKEKHVKAQVRPDTCMYRTLRKVRMVWSVWLV